MNGQNNEMENTERACGAQNITLRHTTKSEPATDVQGVRRAPIRIQQSAKSVLQRLCMARMIANNNVCVHSMTDMTENPATSAES